MSKYLFPLAGLLSLSLSGCASMVGINEVAKPDFFIDYGNSATSMNNEHKLFSKLDDAVSKMNYGQEKYVVFVASANSPSDYDKSVNRFFDFHDKYENEEVKFRLIVQPLERSEQDNLIAVYSTTYWNRFNKQYMMDGDFSWIEESNGVFKSEDERYFMLIPQTKFVTFFANANNLNALVSALGWTLDVSNANQVISHKKLKADKFSYATIGKVASSDEMSHILDRADYLIPRGHKVSLDVVNKVVIIIQ